jgi:hypothetical protein
MLPSAPKKQMVSWVSKGARWSLLLLPPLKEEARGMMVVGCGLFFLEGGGFS